MPRPRSDTRPRRFGVLVAVPIFAVTMAACAMLNGLGWFIAAIILAVIAGMAVLVLLIPRFLLAFGGLFLCVTAGIMATSLDTPLLGRTASGIRVDQAADSPHAAIFHFTDGHVLTSAARSVPIYGGTKGTDHILYFLEIAPIVDEGWTPDRPVTAWAVTSPLSAGLPRSQWSRQSRAGVRAAATHDGELRHAIALIERQSRIHSLPHAPLIHWLDDPEAVLSGQRWKLASMVGVIVALWGALVLADLVLTLRQGRARA